MAEPPDLEELARRTLELWQRQLGAAMTDPQTAAFVRQWLALAGGTLPVRAGEVAEHGGAGEGGAAPAHAASEPGLDAVRDLARRLDDVERRLAALETGPRGGGGGARGRPRKRSG